MKLGRRYECSIFRASILLQGYKRDVAAEVAAGQHTRNTQTAELSRIDLEKKARELDACAGRIVAVARVGTAALVGSPEAP